MTISYREIDQRDPRDFDSFLNSQFQESSAPVAEAPATEPAPIEKQEAAVISTAQPASKEATEPTSEPKVDNQLASTNPIEAARAKEKARLSASEKMRLELEEKNKLLAQYQQAEKMLTESGWDVEKLITNKNPHAKSVDPTMAELNSLRKQIELDKTLASDRELLSEIKEHIQENDSDYEFIVGNEVEVLDLIKTVKGSGKNISIAEAVKTLEDVLEEQAEALAAKKAAKVNKKQGKQAKTEISKDDTKATQTNEPVAKKAVVSEEDEFLESMKTYLKEQKPQKTLIRDSAKAALPKVNVRSSSTQDFEAFLKERLK